MNSRQFSKIIKQHLIDHFPGFVTTGHGDLVAVPLNHLWRGFSFSGSSHSKSWFYVYADVMPLYVPTEFSYLATGGRLIDATSAMRDIWEWNESSPDDVVRRLLDAMKSQGFTIINNIRSPLEFARKARIIADDPNSLEAVAYSLVYSDLFEEALPMLHELVESYSRFVRPGSEDWKIQKLHRRETLLELVKKDPPGAKRQLEEWEKQTIANLKLEKLPN